jgi:Fe-S oxidoreductase
VDEAQVQLQASSRRGFLPVDENELVACIACGLCLPHCPTYRVSGLESLSPRGRIAAMRAVELGGAPVDRAFRESMETCVQCRCEAAVPSSVPFGNLIEATRARNARTGPGRFRRLAGGSGTWSSSHGTDCSSR